MNIALTYFCNQKCKYCFGMDAMSIASRLKPSREMTFPDLYKIIRFMKKSGIRRFNMIGGEPTLHSQFEKFYKIISDNGLNVMIFSNGVIDKEKVDFLSAQDSLNSILLNIREPQEYSKAAWEKIEYTLSRINKKVNLSFRIYRMDFNPVFLFDLIDKHALPRMINWAIACPSLVSGNKYVRLEDHCKAVKRMVKFSRVSKKRRIGWYTDSGFIFCAFSADQSKKLFKNTGFIPEVNCQAPLEVAPDLRVFRCYGLASKSRPGLKITDFKSIIEAKNYFNTRSLPLKRLGGMDKCFKCEHIISQKCGGGCMVHILKKFPQFSQPLF